MPQMMDLHNGNLVIYGKGGQGVMTLGKILATSLAEEGFSVVVGEIRNSARRGGCIKCDVRWTTEQHSLDARVPMKCADLLLFLEFSGIEKETEIYASASATVFALGENGSEADQSPVTIRYVPRGDQTERRNDNMLLLGHTLASGLLPVGKVNAKRVIRAYFHRMAEPCLRAFDAGFLSWHDAQGVSCEEHRPI